MDSADQLLVLAHGIETYDRVVRDLTDLANMQVPTSHTTMMTARTHLVGLAQLWSADVHGNPVWHDERLPYIVEEAQLWVAARQARLSELREGKVARGN